MGEVFAGRYELVDPIGRGGVGAVWRTWDHRRRRYVAAKVLLQSDAHSLLRFVREQALRIDHPHVLAPTSWAADDDKVLFTMDLVAGGSLAHLVGDYGPLPPAFVCTLLDQLLSGLAAVHAEDVVHRDIKPANVLLEATGTGRPRLRLSDFGIAMRLGEPRLTETNLVVGTPGYLAPEQMMGSDPDFPADLFAVGLVALYLLEGAKPDAKALVQHFADHGTPGAPRGIPEPLWQVVATLLQPDPQARFRTATGARKALAAAAELLPEPGPDDELIEVFDQLGPLPPGFAADGPLKRAPGLASGSAGKGDFSGTGSTPSVPGRDRDTGTSTGTGTDTGMNGGTGGGAAPVDPRRSTTSATPPAAPSPTPSGAQTAPSVPPQPPGMSDTGSFHLPPPRATVTSSPAPAPPPPAHGPQAPDQALLHAQHSAQHSSQHGAPHQPAHVTGHGSPHDPTHPLRSLLPHPTAYPGSAPPRGADASTAEYTAQSPRVPPAGEGTPRHGAAHRSHRRSHRRSGRRPGPPVKIAVPLLFLALVCYAVGFWALTRI
ncbi:serine/threonine-protein kinase [Streptomyces viridosporus]|uniref:serine/threonine-protein kinase n=1 Tax=Streptomyces viridosporus TaxID=67581 RepID=UPI0036FDF463